MSMLQYERRVDSPYITLMSFYQPERPQFQDILAAVSPLFNRHL